MDKGKSHIQIQDEVIQILRNTYDPEIPVNIYELGLIYEVNVDPANNVHVLMTLTTPNCPVAESLPNEVQEKIKAIEGVGEVNIELTFDPPWNMDMMSDEAKLELGLL